MSYIFHCCLPIVVIISCCYNHYNCCCSKHQTWISSTSFAHVFLLLFLQCRALIVTLSFVTRLLIHLLPPSTIPFPFSCSIVRLYGRVTITQTHCLLLLHAFYLYTHTTHTPHTLIYMPYRILNVCPTSSSANLLKPFFVHPNSNKLPPVRSSASHP